MSSPCLSGFCLGLLVLPCWRPCSPSCLSSGAMKVGSTVVMPLPPPLLDIKGLILRTCGLSPAIVHLQAVYN